MGLGRGFEQCLRRLVEQRRKRRKCVRSTLTLADRQAVVPGQPTTLDVGLIPTDAILQPTHRLRVDIYAANFPKGMMIPALLLESQLKPQHLVLDPTSPSFVNVPVSRPI